MKAQSEFIAFIIVVILIVVVLVPLALLVLNFSQPSAKTTDSIAILQRQINGGSILLYFNATPNPMLITFHGGGNYSLEAIFYQANGRWINITNQVTTKSGSPIPAPLNSNFTLPSYVWNKTLLLEVEGYNVSVFATALPNKTAFA
ncbi:MAG: hypothetical protein QW494_02555 [Metallosphaera sp.]